MAIKALKGFEDVRPPEMWWWHRIEDACRRLFETHGYHEIRIPMLERTELFARSIGAATDIVEKEMYTFEDRSGRSLTLRPEGTAGVVRAYVQHGLGTTDPTSRFWYAGPMFRYERPQKGRKRQFYQVGCEAFGVGSPRLDAEMIAMLQALLREIGIADVVRIEVSSLGDAACRPAYREKLRVFLEGVTDRLCPDCQRRVETNPLRVLDCKQESCRAATAEAPLIRDHLCEACADHDARMLATLDLLGVPYEINPRIVRGLDYYVRTAFELIATTSLGTQNAVGGGGRYDGLVQELGGPQTPGIGFALGMERLGMVLADRQGPAPRPPLVYVVTLGDESFDTTMKLSYALRAAGVCTEMDYESASAKAQLRRANRRSAVYAVIVGEQEIAAGEATVRRMADGAEERVALRELPQFLAGRIEERERSDGA